MSLQQEADTFMERNTKEVRNMDMSKYQELASATAIYKPSVQITYPALGLAGEAGEVSNKIKKMLRDNITPDKAWRESVGDEIGDVLWYCAALAGDLGLDLGEIASRNVDKLKSRQERGKLSGNGDTR